MNRKAIKNKMLLSARRKAEETYKDKPFDSDYMEIFTSAKILKYLFSAVSVITGFFYLKVLFAGQFEEKIYSRIIAGFILFSVEFLKYYLTPKGFNRMLKSKYLDGVLLLAVAIPLYFGSIFFSVNGVKQIFNQIPDQENNFRIEMNSKVDSINNYYDKAIQVEQKKITTITESAAKDGSLKWKTTVDQLNNLEERVDNLYNQKQSAITELKSYRKDKFEKKKDVLKSNLSKVVYIGIITETLLLLCFLFSEYYLYRSYLTTIHFRMKSKIKKYSKK